MVLTLPFTPQITQEIKRLLAVAQANQPPIVAFDSYFERLAQYSVRGKMVRSNLVLIAWQGYQQKKRPPTKAAIQLAAIQELSESGILLQDDVIDNDVLRRGQPTMHLQYRDLALKRNPDLNPLAAQKFGESWAFLLGDVLYFYLFSLLASLPTNANTRLKLIKLYGEELMITGSGQLGDVLTGFGVVTPNEKQVTEINRQKTAHYTICLPLLAGATLAGQPEPELNKLTSFGETVGQLFQLTDDRLDLFSDEETSGKSQGSDVRTGKRTQLYFLTVQAVTQNKAQLKQLESLYGNPKIDSKGLETMRKLMIASGAFDQHQALIQQLATEANTQLNHLLLNEQAKSQVRQLIEFLVSREH